MDKYLHIVCHDVPYPLDYGGVFDLYCKLGALKEEGVRIILHCFEYGRGRQPELNRYCEEVHYYHRNEGHKGFSARIPYIVASRSNLELQNNLAKDKHPILLEGIHCSYLLHCERFRNRRIFMRLHNVEYEYYYQLFRNERSMLKKLYFYHESCLLKKYEKRIAARLPIIAVAEKDAALYEQKFHATDVKMLPVFVPWSEVKSMDGLGTYCLYHGNLSVPENEKAAMWLLEIFAELDLPFVIAGKNPGSRLTAAAHANPHCCLLANPAEDEMRDLIAKAQINILPSFNETGIKLKLLNALFNGRHCVVNGAAVEQTELAPACHLAETKEAFKETIRSLYLRSFDQQEKNVRREILCRNYNNANNAKKLITWIW